MTCAAAGPEGGNDGETGDSGAENEKYSNAEPPLFPSDGAPGTCEGVRGVNGPFAVDVANAELRLITGETGARGDDGAGDVVGEWIEYGRFAERDRARRPWRNDPVERDLRRPVAPS